MKVMGVQYFLRDLSKFFKKGMIKSALKMLGKRGGKKNMNILVINGSPNGERSTTLKLTKTFLEGMGESAEVIDSFKADVKPCRACFSCWFKTPGVCPQKDDMAEILEKIEKADLVIWSTPLYCYAVPSGLKAIMDRTVATCNPSLFVGEDGRTHHPGYEEGTKKTILIASGALPDVQGNFDGVVFQVRHMFGIQSEAICCAEASLFMSKKTRALMDPYLEAVKKAGAEYKETGHISEETQKILDIPVMPRDEFISFTNGRGK